MRAQCAYCGAETHHPEFFYNEERTFRTAIRKVCPPCWQRRTRTVNWRWLVFNSVVLLLAAGFVISKPDFKTGWVFLNLYLFNAGVFLSIVPHELGHLAAAKLLGLRAFRMVIGSGRVLLSWKTFGVPTELRVWPVEGFVQAGFITKNWFRLKNAIF